MKKILLLATLLPLAVFAQKDVTKENYDPFFTKKEAPHIENVLPAPPTLTDPRFFDDWAQYQWGKSIRDTERGKLAVEDAGIYAGYFMKRFSPAMEGTLTPKTHPILYRLLSRAHRTEQQAGASAKAYFKRVRPYQQYKEPSEFQAMNLPQISPAILQGIHMRLG
jgi:acid phosphatase (class A)